jgi:predicted AAA+ superfamily ATPase
MGKSTLMRALRPSVDINLAHEPTYLEFARNPRELESRLAALPPGRANAKTTVLLDEIQRLPALLNIVQSLRDRPRNPWRFLLTGSSARKLRRGEANLLPGRIHAFRMGPIVSAEAAYAIDTARALRYCTLPGILGEQSLQDRERTLRSYAAVYLREEVQAESLTRSLEGFARFLDVVGEWAGAHLDVSKIATAAQVSRMSAMRWTEVLEDTVLVHRVFAFAKSATRRLVQHPKLYFFDVGVLNGLLGNFAASADRSGRLFEHLIFSQLTHSAAAFDVDVRISTFRTEHGTEVDFIVEHAGTVFAIEVKASRTVASSDVQGLARFGEYFGKPYVPMVWYLGDQRKRIANVAVLPWQVGLREMGF